MVPPITTANDIGSITFEGEIPRRWHQFSSTGSRVATIGVLGMKPESGDTTATSSRIMRRGVRTDSEPRIARKRSTPPLRNRPAERANNPIKVIRAGLPKPLTACCGSSTPKLTSSATAKRPVSSGANQPLMNRTSETANTSRVINPCGVLAAARNPAASGTAYGRRAAVDIFEADDVVFTEVGAALDLDHLHRDLARVAEAMLRP